MHFKEIIHFLGNCRTQSLPKAVLKSYDFQQIRNGYDFEDCMLMLRVCMDYCNILTCIFTDVLDLTLKLRTLILHSIKNSDF